MPDATGILSQMGIKDVAAWITAYAAVDELIPFDSETLTQNFTRLPDDSLVGSAGRAPSLQGVQACAGQTVHRMDYNNFDTIFETTFGAVASRRQIFYSLTSLAGWTHDSFIPPHHSQISRNPFRGNQ